jgi:lipopolysaccharide transport system permease protein
MNTTATPDPQHRPGGRDFRTVIRPRNGWQAIDFGELWRSRDLLLMFAVRDIKVRYKQTFFGYAWAVVVPAVQVLVFSVFFGAVLGVSDKVNDAAGKVLPYPLFALTGQIVWNYFNQVFTGASGSLMSNAAIIRKIYVPRMILPLAAVGKPMLDAAVVWFLMLGLVLWYAADGSYDVAVTWKLIFSPLLLLAALLPALGMGLIAAALTVNYRDLQSVLPFMVSMLFFVTPVIYSVDLLPEAWAWLLYLNPIAGFVDAHRAVTMDMPFNALGLAISLAISLVLIVAGAYLFTRIERQFADVA